jgi:acetyl-CoA C-acetyltransferase
VNTYAQVRVAASARYGFGEEHQVPGTRTALGPAYGGGSQYFSMWVVSSDS